MSKLRHAVIGVGGIGRLHARAVKQLEETELVAVADIVEETARRVGEEFKVNWYTDYKEMLEKEEVDSVSICTPHYLHDTMTVDCAKYGVHILVEKPMATTIKRADEMIAAAKKAGVKLGVLFQWRVNTSMMAAKRAIDEGSVGEIIFAHLNFYCYRSQKYYMRGYWRGKWAYEGGGVLINQAIHAIDVYQWLVGLPIKRLSAYVSTIAHNIEVEDIAVAAIDFTNEAKGSIFATSISPLGWTDLLIQGDRGAIAIGNRYYIDEEGNTHPCNCTLYRFDKPLKQTILESVKYERDIAPKPTPTPLSVKSEWKDHMAVIRDFAQAVIEDRDPMVPGEEGRKSLEIVNAIVYSGYKGVEVQFPLDPDEYENLFKNLSRGGTS